MKRLGFCNVFLAIITAVLCPIFVSHARADYESVVLADNPLLYLRFEDANMNNGAIASNLGSVARTGTYISKGGANSISPVTSEVGLGQAAYLGQGSTSGGNGDCIDVWDGDQVFSLPDVTYEIWVRIEQGSLVGTDSSIFHHNAGYLTEDGPGLVVLHNEYGIIGGQATNYGFIAPTDDGNWYHVVVTYDSTDSGVLEELYVNGVFIDAAAGPNNLWYDWERITIGTGGLRWYIYYELFGTVDEFAVYDGLLSAERIALHYGIGAGCPDDDGDGMPDCADNCPGIYNPDQADSDRDNIGDDCECEAANLDSVDPVNFEDFAILGEGWSTTGPGNTNRDYVVDIKDLLQVIEHWLDECSQP